jgi:hypothetical protein
LSKKLAAALAIVVVVIFLLAVIAITAKKPEKVIGQEERLAAIPGTAVKQGPSTDIYKPVVHSSDWSQPVPLPGLVNTAGAEDSPFIVANGTWFFFFFTPDVKVPAERQLTDGVTGIWWTRLVNGSWTSPEKIVLNDDVSLDGAEFVLGDTLWFGSVRTGNLGEIDVYTAKYSGGKWTNVQNAGSQLNVDYNIGEFHLTSDGTTMYFHSGNWSQGENMDIWETHKSGSGWGTPVRVSGVNSGGDDGFPYVTPDGNELWFTRYSGLGYQGPAIYRSAKLPNGTWGAPEEIVSNFAGEPTLDGDGNIYFVHHYFNAANEMVEADIYICYKQ